MMVNNNNYSLTDGKRAIPLLRSETEVRILGHRILFFGGTREWTSFLEHDAARVIIQTDKLSLF